MEVVVASTSAVLEQLSNLLSGPYLSIRSIRKSEIEKLRKNLDLLNESIEEADERIEKEDSVRMYTGQLREVTNLIEDVVDEYDLLSAKHSGYLKRAGVLLGKLRSRGNLNRNITNIKTLLVDIRKQGRIHKISGPGQAPLRKRERVSSSSGEVAAVGHLALVSAPPEEVLVGEVGDLTSDLLLGGDLKLSAIAVVGMGGIGKTTLVQRMYSSEAAMMHFETRAWITVSKDCANTNEMLRLMAMKLHDGSLDDETPMSREDMVKMTRELLRGKRYLLVFDDVWKEDIWGAAREFLPDDGVGSRVVVTTRMSIVADSCDRIHKMNILTEDASLEFFCRFVFGFDRCPDDLRELSAKIVGMCKGLPLAIRVIAGVLSTKEKVPEEWQRMIGNMQPNNNINILETIALSFDSLPPHLKKCFMYFSIFPEDSVIHEEKLLRLWIAEGFVHEMPGKTLEKVAEQYLMEFENRGMVLACQGFYGMDRFFQVHDLIHEMVRIKAVNRDFCDVNDGEASSSRVKCRRVILSSVDNVKKALNATKGSQVRSVFLWNTVHINESVLVRLFKKFYLLTMLDIENSLLESLPKEVGDLACLKYLSLNYTGLRKLPETVCLLSRLQMMSLSGSLLVELPVEIAKLANLRHLQASHVNINGAGVDSGKGLMIKKGIGALANLQTLETVNANLSGIDVMRELKKLKQLRTLKVSSLTTELATTLCACIDEMKNLESLHLNSMTNETLDLETISSPPTQLQRLVLKGELQSLPDWIPRLQNLRLICLGLSNLNVNPVSCLSHLPKLESLWLYGAYQGPRLAFEDGFGKLKLLVLREMRGLEEIEIAEDALPLLEELRIGPSPFLTEVPARVPRLRFLKVLSFYDMPDDFVLRLQPNDGSEFSKVENILSVLFWYKQASGGYVSYRLGEPELLRRLREGEVTDRDRDTDSFLHRDYRMSFSYSEDDEGDIASLASSFQWENIGQSIFTSDRSSFFSDDIED